MKYAISVLLLALTFATPATAAPEPNARCISAAAQAGLLGPDRNPGNTNFVSGTDDNESFEDRSTAGQDVFCGFGGMDFVHILDTGDVFLGGEGNDGVNVVDGSTFNGGAGHDHAYILDNGTFNGGEGNDSVNVLEDGTFNGEADSDVVLYLLGGTFNQD